MTTKRQKGSAYELEVQKILEGQGYTCHRAYSSTVQSKGKFFCRSNDIFGVIDIIAKREGDNTRWVQVSTGTRRAEKEKKLLSIGNIWNYSDKVELWLRFPNGEWKIYLFKNGGFKEFARIISRKYYEVKEENGKSNS